MYYKARGKQAKFCIHASQLNSAFESFLTQFEYDRKYKDQIKTAIELKLKQKLAGVLQENIQIKKRITELKNQLELLEEKYVFKQNSRRIIPQI